MSPLTEPTKLTLAKTYVGVDDPDAANYIALVEAADTAAGSPGGLETATKVAIHSFVKGCKADGIWPAIKASCILAGAKTIDGALVPLAGATGPNKFGTAANWNYDRKLGLKGDGSTNYLDSNRLANADPLNNFHMSVFVDTAAPAGTTQMYIGGQTTIPNDIYRLADDLVLRSRVANVVPITGGGGNTGLVAHSRNNTSSFTVRTAQASTTISFPSIAANAVNIYVFARNNNGVLNLPTTARLSFYSIGEALPDGPVKTGLQMLDERVSALITAIGVAF